MSDPRTTARDGSPRERATMTDRFDELQDGRKLTIKRADGGLLLTIATMHRMETVPLTEERTGDLARWLGGDEAQAERDEWKALAHSTEETLGQMEAECAKDLALMKADRDHWKAMEEGWRGRFNDAAAVVEEANRTGQAMGAAAESERLHAAWGMAKGRSDYDKDAWKMVQAAMEKVPFDRLVALARTVEPDVAAQLERLKAMPSGHVAADPGEPRDTEPPMREAVVGKPSTWEEAEAGEGTPEPENLDRALGPACKAHDLRNCWECDKHPDPAPRPEPAAGYVIDVEPFAHQGYGFTPRAVFPPQVAPGMQGAIDATHAHSAIVLASANRGTPAPEPPRREPDTVTHGAWLASTLDPDPPEPEAGEGGAEFEAFITWWVDCKTGIAFSPEEQDAAWEAWSERADRGTPTPEPWTEADRDVLQAVAHRLAGQESWTLSDDALRLAVLDIERRMHAGTPAPEPEDRSDP